MTLMQPTFNSGALSPNTKVRSEEEEAKAKDDGDKETEEPKETEETEEKGTGGPSSPTPRLPFTRLLTHAAHHSLPAFTTALLTAGADPALKAHIPLSVCVRECVCVCVGSGIAFACVVA